jgi:uncharacterized protein (DUF2384 family)
MIMPNPPDFDAVAEKARSLLGDEAQRWLYKPNRSFAQLSPYELAQSEVGARVVLEELDRTIPA